MNKYTHLCIYIYIYLSIYTHTHAHTHTHRVNPGYVYIHISIFLYIHTYTHTHTHTHTYIYMYIYGGDPNLDSNFAELWPKGRRGRVNVHTHIWKNTHPDTHTHTHAHIHIHTHTHAHTHTHTHTHTHIYNWMVRVNPFESKGIHEVHQWRSPNESLIRWIQGWQWIPNSGISLGYLLYPGLTPG